MHERLLHKCMNVFYTKYMNVFTQNELNVPVQRGIVRSHEKRQRQNDPRPLHRDTVGRRDPLARV